MYLKRFTLFEIIHLPSRLRDASNTTLFEFIINGKCNALAFKNDSVLFNFLLILILLIIDYRKIIMLLSWKTLNRHRWFQMSIERFFSYINKM